MNILESLDNLGFLSFKKLINSIMPAKERRQSEIIINYIRIYSHLNTAFNLLTRKDSRLAFDHLSIARKIIRQSGFEEEMPYFKRIAGILDFILKNKQHITGRIRKDEASDPYHVKTSVLLAENICILRILKINKY